MKSQRIFSTGVKHKDGVNFEMEKEREEVHSLTEICPPSSFLRLQNQS